MRLKGPEEEGDDRLAKVSLGSFASILGVGRRLPVFPWKRTSSGPVAMSQRCCQERKSPASLDHLVGAGKQ
jgi:hypothetical protein